MDLNKRFSNSKLFKSFDLSISKRKSKTQQNIEHSNNLFESQTVKWEAQHSSRRRSFNQLFSFNKQKKSFVEQETIREEEEEEDQVQVDDSTTSNVSINVKKSSRHHQQKNFVGDNIASDTFINSPYSYPVGKPIPSLSPSPSLSPKDGTTDKYSTIPKSAKAEFDVSQLDVNVKDFGIIPTAKGNLAGVDVYSVDYYYFPTKSKYNHPTSAQTLNAASYHRAQKPKRSIGTAKSMTFAAHSSSSGSVLPPTSRKTSSSKHNFNQHFATSTLRNFSSSSSSSLPFNNNIELGSNNPFYKLKSKTLNKDYLHTPIVDKSLISQ
ncbi:hypothetical protein AYI70_g4978 [Smittium culicis]|uniref:Uncharacterized protein n=1 Tax=Smittium culicis TaxID=133412 RepID=A0A1R1X3I7_9FUNG|nr:hypothetical protein AYI70_g11059 [Smittium culicis]OMJ19051.1 hypothetical protein AYI70_g4978 [Smittium culicis]